MAIIYYLIALITVIPLLITYLFGWKSAVLTVGGIVGLLFLANTWLNQTINNKYKKSSSFAHDVRGLR